MRLSRVSVLITFCVGLAVAVPSTARADCNCVAIAADVAAGIQAEIAKADGMFSRGDFNGALVIYANAYDMSKEKVLLYAQGMVHVQLGARAKAKELLSAYLAAGGALLYKAKAEAQLGLLGGATAAVNKVGGKVGGALGGVGGVVGGVGGEVGGVGKGAVDTTVGVAGTGVAATGGVVGGVGGEVKGKAKIGRKAGIVLGVIAVAALGAVLIHSIAAGVSDDIELNPKFDLGLGLTGVSVGITAFYVAGLSAATGAAAGAPCLGANASNAKPVGLAAGFRF